MKNSLFSLLIPLSHIALFSHCATLIKQIDTFDVLYCRVNEVMLVDLEDYITGFNITHKLLEPETPYYNITKKFTNVSETTLYLLGERSPPKINNRYIPRDPLGYFNSSEPLVFLTADLEVYVGNIENDTEIAASFRITHNPNTTCFSILYIQGLIIADCMLSHDDGQTDQFYIFNASNITDQSVVNSTPSCKTYVTGRTGRGIRAFRFSDNSIFVFRYVDLFAVVGEGCSGHVQIWQLDPVASTMTLITTIRRFLRDDNLNLISFEIYLGDLFLLTTDGNFYRVYSYQSADYYEYVEFQIPMLEDEQMLTLRASQEWRDGGRALTLMAASQYKIHVVDWSSLQNPYLRARYELEAPRPVKEIAFSQGFVFLLTSYDNGQTETVTIYRRQHFLKNTIFGYIELGRSQNSFIDTNITMDYLLISSGNTMSKIFVQYSYLSLGPFSAGEEGMITLYSTSHSGEMVESMLTNISYIVVEEDDTNVYKTNPEAFNLINTEYPSIVETSITDFARGPFINFKLQDFPSNSTNATIKNYAQIGLDMGGIDLTNIIYQKAFSRLNDSSIWWFMQNKTGFLSSFLCKLDFRSLLTCQIYQSVYLNGTVTQLEFVDRRIFALLNRSILTVLSQQMEVVDFHLAEGCNDIVPVSLRQGNVIICIQPASNRFVYFLTSCNSSSQISYIDKSHFRQPVVLLSLVVRPMYPSFLFINNNHSEILIVDAELLVEFNQITVIDVISPAVDENFNYSYLRYMVVQEQMVLLSGNNNSKIQLWHMGFHEPTKGSLLKTLSKHPDITFKIDSCNNAYSSQELSNFYLATLNKDRVPQIAVYSASLTGNANFLAKIPLIGEPKNASILLTGVYLANKDADLVFAATENKFYAFIVYEKARISFNSFIEDHSSPQETKMFLIEALDENNELQCSVPASLITFNTQRAIEKITKDWVITDLININETTHNEAFIFQTNKYFNGTVLFYSLQTNRPEDRNYLSLKTKIAFHRAFSSEDNPVRDIIHGHGNIYIQGDRGVTKMLFRENITCNVTDARDFQGAHCPLIDVDDEGDYTISLCFDSFKIDKYAYLIGLNFTNGCEYEVFMPQLRTTLISADQMRLRKGMLFILENQKGQDVPSYARIHYWNFSDPMHQQYLGYIDQIDFNANDIDGQGFEVAVCERGWRVFLVDATVGIRTALYTTERGFFDFRLLEFANETDIKNLKIPSTTIWTGIALVKQIKSGEIYDLILTAKNYNSYYVRWSLQPDNRYFKIIQGYYRYPNFDHETKVSVTLGYHSYFALNAIHLVEGKSIILLYNITDIVAATEYELPSFQYQHFIDYTPFKEENSSSEAFLVISDSVYNRTWIWASSPDTVPNLGSSDSNILDSAYCLYEVFDSVQIVVQSAEIHSTTILVEVSNDLNKADIRIQVNNSKMNLRARKWFFIFLAVLLGSTLFVLLGVQICMPNALRAMRRRKLKLA